MGKSRNFWAFFLMVLIIALFGFGIYMLNRVGNHSNGLDKVLLTLVIGFMIIAAMMGFMSGYMAGTMAKLDKANSDFQRKKEIEASLHQRLLEVMRDWAKWDPNVQKVLEQRHLL
jgi:hypothetical protein